MGLLQGDGWDLGFVTIAELPLLWNESNIQDGRAFDVDVVKDYIYLVAWLERWSVRELIFDDELKWPRWRNQVYHGVSI